MASRIEDYAIVGGMQSVALICTDGSVDWLCLPRFDSEACFAALLGTHDHGQWRIAPATPKNTGGLPEFPQMNAGACQARSSQTASL